MKRWCLPLAACLAWAACALGQERIPLPPRLPAGATAHRDLVYVPGGHRRQRLDLYLPANADGRLPLIVWIHGGGWQGGSKDGCPPLREGFLGKGYAVASLNYRLSQHAVFPAQIDDCLAAIRWLKDHAATYHLDPDRFGLWGASAGGHLAALAGTRGSRDPGTRVKAVCDYFGPTDFEVFVATPGYERHAGRESAEAALFGGPVSGRRELARQANPIRYIDPQDPPFLIVHGDRDKVVPLNQSELLAEALRQQDVPVTLRVIEGGAHGGPGFRKPEVRRMVEDFFEVNLKPGG
jgi:acetyl esterase/lipase